MWHVTGGAYRVLSCVTKFARSVRVTEISREILQKSTRTVKLCDASAVGATKALRAWLSSLYGDCCTYGIYKTREAENTDRQVAHTQRHPFGNIIMDGTCFTGGYYETID